MYYKSTPPSPWLQDAVIHFWQLSYSPDEDSRAFPSQLPAMVGMDMVFQFKEPFKARWMDGHVTETPVDYITGPVTEPTILENVGEGFGIHLQHTAAFRLWGLPVKNYVNNPTALADALGREGEELIQQIHGVGTFHERVKVAEHFLVRALAKPKYDTQVIDRALEMIKAHNGFMPVQVMADKAGLSSRQFNRIFVQQVGLSPKLYTSIIRTHYMIATISQGSESNWQDLIFRHHFFDQSHLIRDFKRFTGALPTEYFKKLLHKFPERFIAKQEA